MGQINYAKEKEMRCDGRIICAAEGGTSRREAPVLLGRLAVRFIDDLSEGLKQYGIRSRRITQENVINL
jgi:intein/homing endonuclease